MDDLELLFFDTFSHEASEVFSGISTIFIYVHKLYVINVS